MISPRQAGRIPYITFFMKSDSRNFSNMTAAAAQISRVGDRTPRLAETAPASPATRVPAKVAQFSPSGPGVISAMATMSLTSERVIQPWDSISLLMRGTILSPPKLVKPILQKDQNSSRRIMSGLPSGNARRTAASLKIR